MATTDESISPDRLYERIERGEGVSVLDVRDRDEFEAWHIDGDGVDAVQIPEMRFVQAEIQGTTADLVDDLAEPITVVCARGRASDEIAGQLRDAGVDAVNLAEGMNGWARVYDADELAIDADAEVLQYRRPASGCLGYLVVSGDEAAVIDPLRAFAGRYVADAEDRGADLVAAVDTHVHADHVSGVRAVADAADAAAWLPAGAEDRGLAFEANLYEDGDRLRVGDADIEAIHAPGHTSELCVLRVGGTLFSADTLFLDGVGRPDLERGADGARDLAADLYDTLHERLLDLPDDTLVAPGHYGDADEAGEDDLFTARLGDLADRLDALSMDRESFVEFAVENLSPRPANHEQIVAANLGRDELPDEEAFEAELGPNNCAVADAG
ncbi:Glyoxylase, beta-lactamase superfamily II [Natronoarchaeum philippinense]|uniref:Glyoxylase, beta-lactamase superfamily II n=1 Tax=Natronoarchaeum philippinense TaxID=558529 RepID=A0A285NSY5_NATPI|nr:MBL fold metallo-hydrolase [Natronoarchaeum philippinense]SNZ12575.1 Glyoxylase, beta-lactamase superfamily II [Natronoarchaeum philippinense]